MQTYLTIEMSEWFCHYLIRIHLISFYSVTLVCLCLEEGGICAPDEAGFNEVITSFMLEEEKVWCFYANMMHTCQWFWQLKLFSIDKVGDRYFLILKEMPGSRNSFFICFVLNLNLVCKLQYLLFKLLNECSVLAKQTGLSRTKLVFVLMDWSILELSEDGVQYCKKLLVFHHRVLASKRVCMCFISALFI